VQINGQGPDQGSQYRSIVFYQNEKRNPNNPYIRGVSIPRLKRFQSKFPELIKTNH